MTRDTIFAKRALDGKVRMAIEMRGTSYSGDSVRSVGVTHITADQARRLGHRLLELADEADELLAERAPAKGRRRQWEEREIGLLPGFVHPRVGD